MVVESIEIYSNEVKMFTMTVQNSDDHFSTI